MGIQNILTEITTKELVEELMEREGVYIWEVAPYETKTPKVTGPAIILIVVD